MSSNGRTKDTLIISREGSPSQAVLEVNSKTASPPLKIGHSSSFAVLIYYFDQIVI